MANFKCNNKECVNVNLSINITEYYLRGYNNKVIYTDSKGSEIKCPTCGEVLSKEPDIFEGFCSNISTFNSKSSSEKKEILKKRANDEFKRNKQMREYKEAADREEI